MDLATVYQLARGNSIYADFRNEINEMLTGTPTTVLSTNEFEVVVKRK